MSEGYKAISSAFMEGAVEIERLRKEIIALKGGANMLRHEIEELKAERQILWDAAREWEHPEPDFIYKYMDLADYDNINKARAAIDLEAAPKSVREMRTEHGISSEGRSTNRDEIDAHQRCESDIKETKHRQAEVLPTGLDTGSANPRGEDETKE